MKVPSIPLNYVYWNFDCVPLVDTEFFVEDAEARTIHVLFTVLLFRTTLPFITIKNIQFSLLLYLSTTCSHTLLSKKLFLFRFTV